MFLTKLLPSVLLFSTCLGKPVQTNLRSHDVEAVALEPRALEPRAVLQITGPPGPVHPRLEIRRLQNNADQFNIYLLALEALQKTSQSNKLSYYQIMGIHGVPFKSWDSVQRSSNGGGGYCTHSSNLFPTWHRPYVALYEQTLYAQAQAIAARYPRGPLRTKYQAAALTLRAAYWDWAAAPPPGQSVYPPIFAQPTVQVVTPTGTTTINNPLYSYRFNPLVASEMQYSPFNRINTTLRGLSSLDGPFISDNNVVANSLDNNRLSYRDRLYNLFTSYSNYSDFSNMAWIPSGNSGQYDSLESLHGEIHTAVGQWGHMTWVEFSAFDPTFMLHHAMTDRVFALWQALYPNSWVQPMAQVQGTYVYGPGDVMDSTSPLKPFHSNSGGDFWTSDSVRSMSTFQYTYPEFMAANSSVNVIRQRINELYGNPAASPRTRELTIKLLKRAELSIPSAETIELATDGNSTELKPHYEYIANIRADKFGLATSYTIYLFLGLFNPNPSTWRTEPNLVGTHGVLVPQVTNATVTPTDFLDVIRVPRNGVRVSGTVPLTTMLIDKVGKGELASLALADVLPYLTANLQWRVALADSTQVDNAQVPDLKVSVVSAEQQPARDAYSFPTWGKFTVQADVTAGKTGGQTAGDQV